VLAFGLCTMICGCNDKLQEAERDKDAERPQAQVFSSTAPAQSSIDSLTTQVQQAVDASSDAIEQASKLSTADAISEIEKLRQLEYRVLTFASAVSASEMEAALIKAGMERWDCFHLEKRSGTEELLVFCKRNPHTPLRYLPSYLMPK
jgi:hypothetical protein